MPVRPFRFGYVARTITPGESWAEKARRVEALGYSIFLMPDHFRNQLATVPALTAAALATSRLRVGSLVFANDFRHPAVLAKEAATIDLLSAGRFELGLGAGWMRSEYEEAGIRFDEPVVRVGRLTEAIVIIRRLLAGERVTHVGRHYALAGLEGRPGPTQRPHPPILIGGGGQRTLTLAAREASIVGFVPRARRDGSGLELDDLAAPALIRKIGWVHEAAGDRFGSLELNALVQVARVTDDPAVAADGLTTRFRASRETVLASPYVLLGSIGQICETLHERRERYGISYLSILEDDADALAPVVARLAGT